MVRKFVASFGLATVVAIAAHAASATEEQQVDDVDRQSEPFLSLDSSLEEFERQTELHDQAWQIKSADWAVDLEKGEIEFRNKKGWVITAPVQVVGTYDTTDGTFMWGWDHPSVPDHAAKSAKLVKEFGAKHHMQVTNELVVEIDEYAAWRFTALANKLSNGQGAYRGSAGTTLVYMTFGEVSISKP